MDSGEEEPVLNSIKTSDDSSQGSGKVEELKAKIQGGAGDTLVNNVHHAEQNGHANLPNDVEKKSSSSSSKHHSSKHSSSHHSSSKSSSSKSKDGHSKHSSSSSSSKHREHGSSSSSSKHRDGSSSKHKDGSHSSSSKHRDGSSSSKHHSSSSSKHSSSSSSKHRDGSSSSSKHHSSSSSKHKDGSSSSKHKDGSSSSKHHSSSSDKHKSSSSSKDGEKSKSSHSSSDKHKSSSSSSKSRDHSPSKAKTVEVKKEVESPVKARESPEKAVKEEPKEEPMSDDDVPLSARIQQEKVAKRPIESDDDDDVPLSSRLEMAKKVKKETEEVKPKSESAKKRKQESDNDDDEDYEEKPKKKKKKLKTEKATKPTPTKSPTKGRAKAKEETTEVWRWWEEERRDDGVKWTFLEHKGPVFAPEYEPLPSDIKFYYDGKVMRLSQDTEEVATFYAKMLEHDYTTRDVFNNNFMKDWRKVMTVEEKEKIKDITKCNFKEMAAYFKQQSEDRKNRSKEEKKKQKEENEEIQKEYGFCIMDGHKEKIGNFRIEPPGLFRGRGDHPKQGMLKRRTMPEDVIINCSKNSKYPEAPKGHKWKEIRNDNKVSWLACWNENIQGSTKYVMLNAASRLKGEKDWQKYETARRLHKKVDKIRAQYREDWKSKEMRIRQRAVALYFIDKLALRAGNEKEEGESADTVGCCSLRKEHLTLHEKYEDQEYVVEFDFLGKDSIRYYNRVPVEKRVFKNLQLFVDNKAGEDDVFDRLNTAILNKYLQELMDGLTAKVFRTYNASRTLQEQLNLLTEPDDNVPAKILSYNRANRAVAILCNHQRAAPKNFSKQMENLQIKIDDKKAAIKEAKQLMKDAKSDYKNHKSEKTKTALDKRKKAVERLEEQLVKLEVQATDKEENKEIALGTSKLNYLDPRISVAWCKKWEVPIEKIYNKTQREKFRWAIDMAEADYEF